MPDLVFTSFDADRPEELWAKHAASLKKTATAVEGGTLFRWIDGDKAWVALYDVRSGKAPEVAAAITRSLKDDVKASVGESTPFAEIFASPDARPIEDCAGYVYIPAVDFSADPSTEKAFNRWYDEKHVPEVAIVGLVRGRRFKAERDAWQYAATYDLDSPAVLQSEALAKVRGFGSYSSYVRELKKIMLERVNTLRQI
jgi:hypothetical protein